MTTDSQQSESSSEAASAALPRTSERIELKKFVKTAAVFLTLLLLLALGFDKIIGAYLHHQGERGGLGIEVQMAIEQVDHHSDSVHVIVLGDSVARQLFRPNTEPVMNGPVRFMTTNQAVSLAGQCYLAEGALAHCPHLTDVYLFYLPAAWLNDLPRDLTHDYLCGHFHSMSQVAEVFKVKRDIELSAAHLGRWALPNLMAANSLSRPAFALQPDALQAAGNAGGPVPKPPDPERLLTELSLAIGPNAAVIPPAPPGCRSVVLSPVSRYFLDKLRRECVKRRVRLHVLSCPVSDEKNGFRYVDPEGIYDEPIHGDIPASELVDAVHFRKPFVEWGREHVIEMYRLDFMKPAVDAKN